jgi:ketopantoate reductase
MDVVDRRRGHKGKFRGLYPLKAIELLQPSDGFELIIVPVKHYQLDKTLAELVPLAGTADFILLTQNWDGVAAVDALLPRTHYLYGDAKAGGAFIDGTLVCALRAIDIGPAEGTVTFLEEKAARLFCSADITTRLHADMLHYLWVQYAFTGAMWAALIDAGSVAAIFADCHQVNRLMAAARECLNVARHRGVDLAQYPDIRPFMQTAGLGRRLAIFMAGLMFKYDAYTRRCSAHAFGDPVEVAHFYDDLVGSGHFLGVPMPVMDSYAASIRRFAGAGDDHST